MKTASSVDLVSAAWSMSCVDGREPRRIFGTPGGDMGEFCLALSALDDMTGGAYVTSEDRVHDLLKVIAVFKGAFYMCTDTEAVAKLEEALAHRKFSLMGAERSPPSPSDTEIFEAVVQTEHIGCRPLRLAVEQPREYGMRPKVVEWAIRSFYRLLWSSDYAKTMHLVVLTGEPKEKAVLKVEGRHLVAPRCGAQALVVHTGVVRAERERLAYWLAHHVAKDSSVRAAVDEDRLLSAMNTRGDSQLELIINALVPSAVVLRCTAEDEPMTLYGVPASANSMGPALLAQECHVLKKLTPVDLASGEHKTTHFTSLNPFKKVPALQAADGTALGESNAILRYVAMQFGPKGLYPVGSDPKKCAKIDFAMDSFVNEVYSNGHVSVVYPVLGFAPKPDDQQVENAKYEAALSHWCDRFLADRFVGGASPCIADFKIAPFFFCCATKGVAHLTGFKCPDRVRQFVEDFAAFVPSATMLGSSNGGSLGEVIDTKLKESLLRKEQVGAALPSPPATPVLLLGSVAPDFTADTTHGRMRFHDYIENSWSVLFSHPVRKPCGPEAASRLRS